MITLCYFKNTSPSRISNLVLYYRSVLGSKYHSFSGRFDLIRNKLTVDSNSLQQEKFCQKRTPYYIFIKIMCFWSNLRSCIMVMGTKSLYPRFV